MITELKQEQKTLYDADYNLWVIETVKKLQTRDFDSIDWDNLIDVVLDLSRRENRRMESLLTRLFEHLLKLEYWKAERDYKQKHWKKEILNFRQQIKKELKVSPSLKHHLQDVFAECYQDARQLVSVASGLPISLFPESPNAKIEQILDENWWH